MLGFTASTSAIRPPETEARGRMMNIIDIIRKEKTTCIAYCRKAIISPTCSVDAATWCAPTQMMSTDKPFINSIITGIMITMMRLTKRLLLVRSTFALSKRSSSKFWVLKARMTMIPERASRVTRLSRSMRLWMRLKRGRATMNTVMINASSSPTPRPMIQVMEGLLATARMMAPTPMIGA